MSISSLQFEGQVFASEQKHDARAISFSKIVLDKLASLTADHNTKHAKKVNLNQVRAEFLSGETVLDGFNHVARLLKVKESEFSAVSVASVSKKGNDFEVSYASTPDSPIVCDVEPAFLTCNLFLGEKQVSLLESLI